MVIEFIYDLAQYSWVLKPIERVLKNLGHTIITSKTYGVPQEKSGCECSLALQNVAYHRKGGARPRFFINHGSSASKGWDLKLPIDFFIAQSPYWFKRAQMLKEKHGHTFSILGGNVGYPRMDVLVPYLANKETLQAQIRKAHNLHDGPIVVCFPTYKKAVVKNSSTVGRWTRLFDYRQVLASIDSNKYNVFVAPHIMDTTKQFDAVPRGRIIREHTERRLILFATADAIISDTSGAAYEAAGLDIPVILTEGIHKLAHSAQEDVTLGPVSKLQDLTKTLDQMMQDPTWFSKEREYWKNYIIGPVDGHASDRIARLILDNV